MKPAVLIIEARKEVAEALHAVMTSANFIPMVVPHLDRIDDLPATPDAIIVRIAFESTGEPPHAAIGRLAPHRPPVIAIVWEAHELAEAQRLKCDVILRAPHDISRLCDTVARLVQT